MCSLCVPGFFVATAFNAMHNAHSCGNTQWIRSELFTHSYENVKTPTRVVTQENRLYSKLHGVNTTTKYVVNDATWAKTVYSFCCLEVCVVTTISLSFDLLDTRTAYFATLYT